MRKYMTRDQAAASKERAERFVDNVLDDPSHADDIANESLDDWIARKGIHIVEKNPRRQGASTVAKKQSVQSLQDQIAQLQQDNDDLQQENDDLQDQLDQVFDIVAPPDEDEGNGDDDDNGDGDPEE